MAQPAAAKSPAFNKNVNIALWALQVLAAAAFLAAGIPKLAGAAQMVDVFQKVGIGQWFRYVTGSLEILGAIGLLIPRYTFYAASLLAIIMVGALVAVFAVLGGSPAPAAVLLLITAAIAYLRRPR
jgi:putative oxidoreductase